MIGTGIKVYFYFTRTTYLKNHKIAYFYCKKSFRIGIKIILSFALYRCCGYYGVSCEQKVFFTVLCFERTCDCDNRQKYVNIIC